MSFHLTDKEEEIDLICELDEYAQLVTDLRESGIVKDHRQGLHSYKSSFVGREAVDWLVKTKDVGKLNEFVLMY